jgi:4-nitrophenyl phosphatase
MAPQVLSTPEDYQKLIDSVEVFLLDCDGVIYHGPVVVPGVKEVLKHLRAIGTIARPVSDIDRSVRLTTV